MLMGQNISWTRLPPAPPPPPPADESIPSSPQSPGPRHSSSANAPPSPWSATSPATASQVTRLDVVDVFGRELPQGNHPMVTSPARKPPTQSLWACIQVKYARANKDLHHNNSPPPPQRWEHVANKKHVSGQGFTATSMQYLVWMSKSNHKQGKNNNPFPLL